MKTKIEKAVELEKGKFYIFEVTEDITQKEIRCLEDSLYNAGIKGMFVFKGKIQVLIPKKEK